MKNGTKYDVTTFIMHIKGSYQLLCKLKKRYAYQHVFCGTTYIPTISNKRRNYYKSYCTVPESTNNSKCIQVQLYSYFKKSLL